MKNIRSHDFSAKVKIQCGSSNWYWSTTVLRREINGFCSRSGKLIACYMCAFHPLLSKKAVPIYIFKIIFPLIYVFVQAAKLILKVVFLLRVICVRRTLLGIGCPKKLKVIFSLNVFVQATKCISIACCVCIVCVGPFPFWEGCLHFLLLIRWLLSRNEVDCNGSPEGKTAKTVPFLLCPPMTHLWWQKKVISFIENITRVGSLFSPLCPFGFRIIDSQRSSPQLPNFNPNIFRRVNYLHNSNRGMTLRLLKIIGKYLHNNNGSMTLKLLENIRS